MPKTDWWCGLGEIQETRVNIRKARVSLDDFNQQIMDALKRRIDPKTGLARPDWKRKTPDISYQRISGLVGAEGFEPSAFCSRSKRATRLRYAPTRLKTMRSISYVRRGNQVGTYWSLPIFRPLAEVRLLNLRLVGKERSATATLGFAISKPP